MLWNEVRQAYPKQWVVLEAISAHDVDDKRIFEDIAVVKAADDVMEVYQKYKDLHKKHPEREFLYISTEKKELDITVQRWVGVRGKP